MPEQPNFTIVTVDGRPIRMVSGHPFNVKDKGWRDAADLVPGDLLRTADGAWAVVQAARTERDIGRWPFLGFAAGTPIRTSDGATPIDELQPGDLIDSSPDEPDADPDDEPPWRWN